MSSPEPLLPRVTTITRPLDRTRRRRVAHEDGADGSPRTRRVRHAVGRTLLAGFALLLLGGLWVGSRAATAVTSLTDAMPAFEDVAASLSGEPRPAVLSSAQEVRQAVGRARDAVGDPVWRVAELLPGVGDRLEAVRSAVTAADILATDALGPVLSLADAVTFGPYAAEGDGYAALVEARELDDDLAAIAAAVLRARDEVAHVPTTDLFVPAVSEPFADALATLDQAADVASVLRPGLEGMLEMTGYTGTSRTLVVVLDARAPRAVGGSVERALLVTAEHGELDGVTPVDAAALVAASAGAEHLPSTPAAATALRSGAEQLLGAAPDAVVLLTLEGLDALGRLAVAEESETLVAELPPLAGVVDTLDPAARSAVIDAATDAAVRVVFGLSARADDLALAVRDAVAQGGLRVWFADPELQAPLASTRGAGALPAATVEGIPVTVVVDDASPARRVDVTELRASAGTCGGWFDEHPVGVLTLLLAAVDEAAPVEGTAPVEGAAPAEGVAPVEGPAPARVLVGIPAAATVRSVTDGDGAELRWSEAEVDGHRLVDVAVDAGLDTVRVTLDGRADQPDRLLVVAGGGVPAPSAAPFACP